MGGGDLNMKKSWHPNRMDNQEKVWKKEEENRKERQRMAELKRQMREEREMEELKKKGEDSGVLKKKKDRVDWLYQQPQVNEEDYLMGKKVDQAILEHQETKAKEAITGGPSLVVDMAAKVREDPLFNIKKQEMNHRKALMNNPIRMKQLQQMLKKQVEAKEGQKKSKKSKHDKSKKKRDDCASSEERKLRKKMKIKKKASSRRDDSSDSDSDEEETRRRRKREKLASSRRRRSSGESSSSEDERRKRRAKEQMRRERRDLKEERTDSHRCKGSSDRGRNQSKEVPRRVIPEGYGLIGGKKTSHRRRDSSSDSEDDRPQDRTRDRHHNRSHDRYDSRQTDRRRSPDRSPRKKPKVMDAAELERRRAEMMDNAKWRDEQRQDRVKRYKDEESAEAAAEKQKSKDAKFLDSMRLPSHSSVEDRIKSNIYNIQRTSAALDKNFARR